MKKARVKLEENSYEVLIGANIYPQLGGYLKKMGFKGTAVMITNPVVQQLYGSYVQQLLMKEGFNVSAFTIEDGEAYKSMDSAMQLYGALCNMRAERSTLIIALGGGVIGDIAGFVAATYLRGLPLVHLPTTLLAQVDSSIGGKVAVDLNNYKNIVGAFYQPKLVMADISVLKTLPEIEMNNGIAEVIKYGIIRDPHLFTFAGLNLRMIKGFELSVLEEVIYQSASIKADVVSEDEKDTGARNILNYGHTVGHAIEAISGFNVKHGGAVAVGMVAAGRIAVSMGKFNKMEFLKIKETLESAGLPSSLESLNLGLRPDDVIEAMKYDKKIVDGKSRFVLPKSMGSVFIADSVSAAQVKQALEAS
jgi:3-dehydroquinate synthase